MHSSLPDGNSYFCREIPIPLVNNLNAQTVPKIDCEDETKESLYERVSTTFPAGCGYSIKQFNVSGFQNNIQNLLKGRPVACDEKHNSMCTSAVFLAFVSHLKTLHSKNLITDEQLVEWSNTRNAPYEYLNLQTRPDLMLSSIGLGDGRTLRSPTFEENNWPREGDIVQIWRKNGSGHSTIFSGFLKEPNGKIKGMCFWSSNLSTTGYGTSCEETAKIDRIIVGRFNQ